MGSEVNKVREVQAAYITNPDHRQIALTRIQAAWTKLLDPIGAEELEQIASRAEAAALTAGPPSEKAGLIAALSERHRYNAHERAWLEIENQEQYFAQRRDLLKGALTTTQVAALLGTSRQTPHDRVSSGTLLGISENGRLMFPPWQFDADGPNGVLAGLPSVLKELQVSPLSKVRWLTRPNATLDGLTPIDSLKRSQEDRVIQAARAVGMN